MTLHCCKNVGWDVRSELPGEHEVQSDIWGTWALALELFRMSPLWPELCEV